MSQFYVDLSGPIPCPIHPPPAIHQLRFSSSALYHSLEIFWILKFLQSVSMQLILLWKILKRAEQGTKGMRHSVIDQR